MAQGLVLTLLVAEEHSAFDEKTQKKVGLCRHLGFQDQGRLVVPFLGRRQEEAIQAYLLARTVK